MRHRIELGIMIIGVALAGCDRVDVEAVSSNLACDIDYAAIKATEMVEIESGLSVYRRFVVDELSEGDLNEEEVWTTGRNI